MIQLKIKHKLLESATLCINQSRIDCTATDSVCAWEINDPVEDITIEFKPFGIVPKFWLNGFLINFWLGDVLQQNHALSVNIGTDFFERYSLKERQGRIDSLGSDPSPIVVDRNIGRNLHTDVLEKLKNQIYEKSRFN